MSSGCRGHVAGDVLQQLLEILRVMVDGDTEFAIVLVLGGVVEGLLALSACRGGA